MTDLIIKLHCHFSMEEKETCVSVIYRVVELANLTRQQGVLALDAEMADEPDFFLKTAVQLVVDGTDPALVKQILQNLILADAYMGADLLRRLLTAEGVLSLQQGENPRIIGMKCAAMLGEKFVPVVMDTLYSQADQDEKYWRLLRDLKDRRTLPECEAFEAGIKRLDGLTAMDLLNNTDPADLLLALQGCGYEMIVKVLNHISLRKRAQLCENWPLHGPLRREDILTAQRKISHIVDLIENRTTLATRVYRSERPGAL